MKRLSAASFVAILAAVAMVACSKKAAVEETPAVAAAEAMPADTDNVHHLKVGALSAMALRDGGLEPPNDNKVFGVGKTPEDVAAVLSAAGQPTDKLSLSIQPLLVKAADRVLLFDTGAGSFVGPSAGHLQASLAEAGIDPASVTDIFISHSHGDHVGGLVNAEGALSFPNATIHLTEAEWNHLKSQKQYETLAPVLEPKVDAFAPGAELISGVVKAVDTHGHTPGHSSYLIGTGADSLLFVGDTMHHFVVSVQKPEWTIAFDGDNATATATRIQLIADSAASGQRVYAYHFPYPGVGKFGKEGETHQWVAE